MRGYSAVHVRQLLCLICCLLPDISSQSEDNDGLFSLLDGNEGARGGSRSSTFDCSKLDDYIVNRYEWRARSPVQRPERFRQTPTRVFVHSTQLFLNDRANRQAALCQAAEQTNGTKCAGYLRQMQAHHQFTNKWPDIGYNYLIANDGTIYEGLGASSQGFHTANYNNESLGVAFIGDYQATTPNGRMVSSLIDLISCLVDRDHLDHAYTLHGHRDARCTPCPGRAAYARLRSAPHFRSGMLPRFTCPTDGQSDFVVVARKRRHSDSQMMLDQVGDQQQRPSSTQSTIPNVDSNNNILTSGVNRTSRRKTSRNHAFAAEIKHASEHPIVDETLVGLLRHNRRHRNQPPSSSSSTTSVMNKAQVTQATRRENHVAAISKATQDKQLILINMPAAQTSAAIGVTGQQQSQSASSSVQLQPAFYLLTTTKTKLKSPTILLLNPTQSSTGSSGGNGGNSGGAGGGDEHGGNGGRGGQEQSSGGGDGESGSSGGGSSTGDGGNDNRRRQSGLKGGSSSDSGGGGSEEGGRGNSSGGESARHQS